MKVLMIGLGSIGQRHTRNLRVLLGNSVEISAYRVRRLTHLITPQMSADSARNVEDEYGLSIFTDLEEALGQKPEIAFICNPNSMHVPVSLSCLKAGCDLFLEKPVSDSTDGLDEMIRLAREKERVVMVGYQLRFHPCLQMIGEIIKDGSLGTLLGVRAVVGEYMPGWHPYEDYRQSYAARADQGGGIVLSQIHELDYLYSLFGLPRTIYAIGGHWSDLEVQVEDTASTLMECALNDRSLPVQLHQDCVQSPASRQCEVIGDRGRVLMDLCSPSVKLYRRGVPNPETTEFAGFERNHLFVDQMKHFLECVKTRKRPLVDLMDGIQSLRMALAIKESIATRRLVELSPRFDFDSRRIAA